MQKRGISAIIVTLILVLLSIVLVGVVWAVVSNIVNSSSSQTSFEFGTLFLDLKIQNVSVDPGTGDVSVTVRRNPGGDAGVNLSGVAFVFSDGASSTVVTKTASLSELEAKAFTFTPEELSKISYVKDVTIAPLVRSGGKDQPGKEVDTSQKNSLGLDELEQNYGLVSWWRLNGDTKDKISGNDGSQKNGVTCGVAGKFEEACQFDGDNDLIQVPNDNSLSSVMGKTNNFTISAWIYPTAWTQYGAISKTAGGCWYQSTNALWTYSGGFRCVMGHGDTASCNPPGGGIAISYKPDLNNWYHVVCTADGTNLKMYVNGKEVGSAAVSGITVTRNDNTAPMTIGRRCPGCTGAISGKVDEVMIFNKGLTANQIKSIYDLRL